MAATLQQILSPQTAHMVLERLRDKATLGRRGTFVMIPPTCQLVDQRVIPDAVINVQPPFLVEVASL